MFYYQSVYLYYFSGTGNAKHCAKLIAAEAEKQAIQVTLCNIADEKTISYPPQNADENTLIGFLSPTHGFNMPPIMLSFMAKFPQNKFKKTNVFILNTRAGMMLWKLFTPGLSGIALLLSAFILLLKGYRIKGLKPIDMSSNWLSLHPSLNNKTNTLIATHWTAKVQQFSSRILSGRTAWRGLWDLPIDLLVSPIAFGYYFIGRFALAKTFFASYQCTDCGLCSKECPVNAIVKKNNQLYWKFTCESCMRCMNNCPEKAIHTAHGFSILVWIFGFSTLPILLSKLSNQLLKFNNPTFDFVLMNIVWPILFLVSCYYSYIIFNFMLRFKWFNYLATYTSLTRIAFWGRYKFKVHKAKSS